VADLNDVEVTEGGLRLRLHVQDVARVPASVSLPVDCLNTVASALSPGRLAAATSGAVPKDHRVDSWSLIGGETGLVLTLNRPD